MANEGAGTGGVRFFVSTGSGAVPLEGASINIQNEQGDGVAAVYTDQNGLSPEVWLPAMPTEASETPGEVRPYNVYNADVILFGYSDESYLKIPVFEGIVSLQSVTLLPLPEGGAPDGDFNVHDEQDFYGLEGKDELDT